MPSSNTPEVPVVVYAPGARRPENAHKTRLQLQLEEAQSLVTALQTKVAEEAALVVSHTEEDRALALFLHDEHCVLCTVGTDAGCPVGRAKAASVASGESIDWTDAPLKGWLTRAKKFVDSADALGWRMTKKSAP